MNQPSRHFSQVIKIFTQVTALICVIKSKQQKKKNGILTFIPGLSVRSIHFTRVNDRLEAFVKFNSCEDVEFSLNIMGKKINDVYVKIYRSSEEQIRMVCTTKEFNLSQLSLQSIEQVPNNRCKYKSY